jgi:IclR family KDG regulon transcriptional repressor
MINKLDQILSLFSLEQTELSGPEIAELIRRPKSTVYRLLGKFTAAGYIDQDQDTGRYRLGIRLAALGDVARHSTSIQRLALSVLRVLTEATGELADLTVLADTQLVTIEVVESLHPISVPGLLGGHPPLHATAAGKVLLAWRPEHELNRFLKPPLKRFTSRTITDRSRLKTELALARRNGYAQVWCEWFDDLVSVAAPVRNHRGAVIAALAVGLPESRCDKARIAVMGKEAIKAATHLSAQLGLGGRPNGRDGRHSPRGPVGRNTARRASTR